MSSWTAVIVLLSLYGLVGLGCGIALRGRGHPLPTAVSALVAWPLLVGLMEATPAGAGPFQARIDAVFEALGRALREAPSASLTSPEELIGLRAALVAADARIGMVDRLLDDPALQGDPLGQRLSLARGHAAAEIEGVLRGLVQLKLQVGLVALLGDTLPVREQMRDLSARARALQEIALS